MGLFSSWGGDQKRYRKNEPVLVINEYFNGSVKAWGMIQDIRGNVDRRFHGIINGEWNGDTGTLTERFEYSDGEVQDRVWTLKTGKDGYFEGTASDIVGKASGYVNGNSALWHYIMQLPISKDKTINMKFKDWLFLVEDGMIINRICIRKFGIKVAELTIVMQKQDAK